MKLKIVKNKDIAFSGFVRNVVHYGMHEWIKKWQKGPLTRLPLKITREASTIFNFYLTYEESPIKDLVQWSNRTLHLLGQLKKVHDKEWKKYEGRISILAKTMSELIKKYGKFIVNIIPKKTGIAWKYEEVWIIPCIYLGATTEDNKIFKGVIKSPRKLETVEENIPGLIHELIHVNELPKYLSRLPKEKICEYVIKEHAKFKFPNASREITTIVLTNSILKCVEKKFGLKFKEQESHPHYGKVISIIKRDLKESPQKGFKKIREYVDHLIIKKTKCSNPSIFRLVGCKVKW